MFVPGPCYHYSVSLIFPPPTVPESPPSNFRIINIGKRSVDLAWGPPQAALRNGPLVQYIIVYGIQGGTIETAQKLKARDLNILEHEAVVHTVEQLTPFTTYFFKVAFANSVGESGFTEKLANTTLPDGMLACIVTELIILSSLSVSNS